MSLALNALTRRGCSSFTFEHLDLPAHLNKWKGILGFNLHAKQPTELKDKLNCVASGENNFKAKAWEKIIYRRLNGLSPNMWLRKRTTSRPEHGRRQFTGDNYS